MIFSFCYFYKMSFILDDLEAFLANYGVFVVYADTTNLGVVGFMNNIIIIDLTYDIDNRNNLQACLNLQGGSFFFSHIIIQLEVEMLLPKYYH